MSELIQRSFSGGEITPSLYSRIDQIKYATGLRTCRNFMVKRHGGVQNRPGTVFVGEVKDSTKTVRLIPFVFNNDQTYMLEFGDQYMRVIRNGSQVTETAQNITAVTQAAPTEVTIAGHGYSNGDEVFISGVDGMVEVNNRNFKVAGVTANTFTLQEMDGTALDSTGYTAYTSGGTAAKIYEIATPYLEADLMDIRYAQSADVVVIVHPDHRPRELARTGHVSWSLVFIVLTPGIGSTAVITDHEGGPGPFTHSYRITAVTEFGEEGVPVFSPIGRTNTSPASTAITLTWTPVTGASSYRIYRQEIAGAPYGAGLLTDISDSTHFSDDDSRDIDQGRAFPVDASPFLLSDARPTSVVYYQGRLCFANTNSLPETVWMSHSGSFKNFTIVFPSTNASRVVFTMAGQQVNSIQHMVDIGRLIIFTASGEWLIGGNDAGIITPTHINPLQQSYNGTGSLAPIVVNDTALYVQVRGTKVRDLSRDINVAGYSGNELTIFASHLFDNYTLDDWAYQKVPDSTIWAARDDGTLLGLTYIKEHEIVGWHRHDFQGGTVERVMAIPEGNEDVPYIVVKREVNGKDVRYIERFSTRQLDDVEGAIFADSSLSYDGTNYGAETMTLSGGSTWAYDETLTLTCSASFFLSSDIGNEIRLTDSDNNIIRFTIEGYTGGTVVTGKPHKNVPVSLQATAVTTWGLAVDQLQGLWHLEGESVSVLGDGFVVASVNNPSYTSVTVTNGAITLDKPFSVIHIGLPITSDIQTLDLDTFSGETMENKNKLVTRVSTYVQDTRGLWSGERPPSDDDADPLEGLREFRSRNEESQELPPSLLTEVVSVNIKGRWNGGGRIFLRQIDPLPATILSIVPGGYLPIRS